MNLDNEEKIQLINKNLNQTLASSIGLIITEIGDRYVCGKMPVDHRTVQPFGLLHGGASVAFAETLGSLAGNLQVSYKTEMVVGIEINANHLKGVRSGWVYGKASPIKIGKKIHIWQINIVNDKKELICVSRLTVAVVSKK